MALPKVVLPTSKLTIEGVDLEVRGLSRSEAMRLTTEFQNNPDDAESFVVACGTGVTIEEATDWRNTAPIDTVGLVVDEIIRLSGLGENKDGKSPQL